MVCKEKSLEVIQTDGRPPVLSPEDGSSGQPGEKTGHRLFPANRPVTEDLGGNIPEPWGVRTDEPGILLIDGNGRSRRRHRFFGEGPVIAVFQHLGVIDEPLVSDPLEQGLFLGGNGIGAESAAMSIASARMLVD